MSDRPCNYCNYQEYKREAKASGKAITLRDEEGWPTVYIHPKSVDIKQLSKAGRKPYFRSSFMELPDHCRC